MIKQLSFLALIALIGTATSFGQCNLPSAKLIQPAGGCIGTGALAIGSGPDYVIPKVLDPQTACALDEYIDNFSLNTFSNDSSGCSNNTSNYTFYSTVGTSVTPGNTYNFYIESPGLVDAMGYAIWIDYNQNGSFDDAGELVYTTPPTNGAVSGTITIPPTATAGVVRMRVRLGANEWFSTGDANLTTDRGETEDYLINIGSGTAVTYSWTSNPSGFTSSVPYPAMTPVMNTTYFLTVTDSASRCSNTTSVLVDSTTVFPSAFAANTWNAYVFNGTNFNTYEGYYTETNLSFNSTNRWDSTGSPSDAAGYAGCPVTAGNHSVMYKRQGFPCGIYSLDIPAHDNGTLLYINDSLVFQDPVCCDPHTKIWTGFLDANARVELSWQSGDTSSIGSLTLNLLSSIPAMGTVNGTGAVCPGTSSVTYTVDSIPGISSYVWSVPQGATITAGTNTNSITVDFAPNAVSGNISVYGINYCGTGSPSSIPVNIDTLPTAAITAGGNTAICDGSNVTLTAATATTYVWSTGATTASIQASTAGTYSATLYSASGCAATSNTITVAVKQLPTVIVSPLNEVGICNNQITLSNGSPLGGTYSGAGVSNGIFYTRVGVGTHTIIYTIMGINGCSNSDSTDIIVDPLPIVSFTGTPSNVGVCNAPITLTTGTPSGGFYSGTSVTGNTFDPSIGQGTYAITYTYIDNNGCSNTATSNITVDALPDVNAGTYTNVGTCTQAFALTNGTPAGGIYSGNGISNGIFNPSTGAGTYTITYTFTDSHGCSNDATTSVTVDAPPVVNAGSYAHFGECNRPFVLTGGTPFGGTYSGTGVNSTFSTFDPATGPGTYTITYSYTDSYGCNGAAISSITVDAPPTVNAGTYPTLGVCNSAITLNGGTPAGGTYSGTGVSNGQFSPNGGGGSYTITYSYIDHHGCTDVATTNITVDPLPTVYAGPDTTALDCDQPFIITGGTPVGGFYSGQGVSNGWFYPSTGQGNYTVRYYYADADGCSNIAARLITVNVCTAVKEMGDNASFVNLYPNPARDMLVIEAKSASTEITSISVNDITGKQVMVPEKVASDKTTLYVSSLAKGLYFVRISTNNNTLVKKITVE